MFHGTGSGLRLLCATMAGVCLLLLGMAGSAHAATFNELRDANGAPVELADGITLTAGSVTESGGELEISDATVNYGDVGVGEGVSGTATGEALTLTGGAFDFDDRVVSGTFTSGNEDPLVFPLGSSGTPSGKLVPVTTKAPAALRAFSGITPGEGEDAALGVLPKRPQDNGPTYYEITLGTGNGSVVANLWQRVRQPNGTVVTTGRVLVNVTLLNRRYRVEVINWQFSFRSSTAVLNAVVAGNDILNPFEFKGVSGSLTGEVELARGLTFTGGSLSWDESGFSVSGGVRVACQEGSVSAGLSGSITDDDDWQFNVNGQTDGGCTVSKDLKLPTGNLNGTVSSTAGAVTGSLAVDGSITTTLLPDGVNSWEARFQFLYDGTDGYIEFEAEAGIGVAEGRVNFDGTFALNADFEIPFGGSNVAFDGDINRTAPNGAVTYDVGGSANIAINDKTTLGGSLRLTNTTLSLAGNVEFACPVSGTIKGGVSGTIPLTSSNDWALAVSGGAGSAGCQVTREFGLGAGTGLAGQVKSVGGVVSVNADASATVNTTLIPTKTSFSMDFAFAASQGAYTVAIGASTQGASFTANVASNGTFGLSFALSDLALGGVTLGARGTINRTTPNGAVTYSISGSLAGQAKIYDNLYLRSGSLSITNAGGLRFSGTVRQLCTSGYLDASANGSIQDSRNFSFSAVGQSSQCRLGRNATFDGRTFFADIDSTNGKVLYNAGVSATRIELFRATVHLIGDVKTWLTSTTGTISNACTGCYDRGVTQLAFQTRVNAEYRVVSKVTQTVRKVSRVCNWLPWPLGQLCKDVVSWVTETVDVWTTVNGAATGYGTVEVQGTAVRKITIGVRDPQFGILGASHWPSLTARMGRDLEVAFTT